MIDLSVSSVLLDAARVVHLFSMAVAIGTVAFTDYSMLRRVQEPIRTGWAQFLARTHFFVVWVTVVIWLSGLCLIWFRTEFQIEAFTAKLWVKLLVVSLLVLTASGIRHLVVPLIVKGAGGTMLDLPWRTKRVIAVFAGMSVAGWTSALILGGSKILAAAPLGVLLPVFAALYAVVILTMLGLARYAHRIYDNPMDRLERRPAAHF